MDTEIVSLEPLYEFVKNHKANEEALRLKNSELGAEYSALCSRITEAIGQTQGFYLWGRFDRKGRWHNIYLGMAGYEKDKEKNLKKRILEELKDERAFVWRHVYSESDLDRIRERIHGRYKGEWNRAMRKRGTTHIAWMSTPQILNEHVTRVEADLIEILNPSANRDRRVPATELQDQTIEILRHLRRTIHSKRRSGFTIDESNDVA